MLAERGKAELVEVAPGVHAYLQKGSWGFSNAGLVSSGDGALLVALSEGAQIYNALMTACCGGGPTGDTRPIAHCGP